MDKKTVRGTVEDALRPATVRLLETDPQEYVRKTRKPQFGFVVEEKRESDC
ncbi:hypothetical protein [Mycobacteroides abscessus]|uniref:hypothetical protein n=1 Tax=Mycobacteroides abscessus TaxID=36809 RepID=UPI0009267FC8|nr:hypothetical protein [Mycobacteroides abscessus]MDM2495874.1 hypothetical protein [Mycobacteroides abscessus]MDM2514708.1 hypothetical protein [Mycobacteroides abscessus]MDM2522456.1 hypothetical protein [Mycobacteroides abscessus]MDM2527411.1 hypothetical protein [Mycobacteroides abscessus]MDM2532403.1 hypothetical protein [Mycobacteroides abscessus]